jgi:opacity protein-like surface antigen
MLFNNKSLLAISTLLAALTLTAYADDTQQAYQVPADELALASQNGYFAGIDLGYTKIDWDSFLQGDVLTSGGSGGFAFALNGGYRWNHRIAIESGFEYLPGVDYSQGTNSYSITNWLSYVAMELDAPLRNKINAFIQAGLGYHYFDDENTGTDTTIRPYYALGFSYIVSSKWTADIKCSFFSSDEEVSGHNGYIPTVNSFLLGAKYKF